MRQRISVEQLKEPVTQQRVGDATLMADKAVESLSQVNPTWLAFCNEKVLLANESLGFLLKQRFQLFKKGFPSRDIDYLNLIERQIGELKRVYQSFYRFNPGFIHQLKSQEIEIYVWLMLQKEFGYSLDNLLCGLGLLNEVSPDFAKLLVVQSTIESLDYTLAELIEGEAPLSTQYFEYLSVRQTNSVALTKRWLKVNTIPEKIAYCALARQDVEDGIEWVNQNAKHDQYLFERLLTRHDRSTWFRQHFGIESAAISHPRILTFAKVLELKEFSEFDVTVADAPIHYALAGDTELTPQILDHLIQLDEVDGEIWLKALYVVYGSVLPVYPHQLGIELEWQEITNLLSDWRNNDGHVKRLPSRLGYELTFDSTMTAMMDKNIDDSFRGWLWQQTCLHSRVYIPWDATMPIHQQEWNIKRLKALPSVAERFNLRGNHAVVGY